MSVEPYIRTCLPHFHVCNGMRPGGCFYQYEAWEVNDWVVEHVVRVVEREAGGSV